MRSHIWRGGDMRGDDAVSIGLRLRAARRAHGHTGQDLRTAVKERLGVEISDASIYRIERGEQDLGSEFLVAFCRLTDTHPVWLLTGREPRTWNDAASDQRYTESAARFLQRCLKLLDTQPDLFR